MKRVNPKRSHLSLAVGGALVMALGSAYTADADSGSATLADNVIAADGVKIETSGQSYFSASRSAARSRLAMPSRCARVRTARCTSNPRPR
jgi:hypothetical protein